jgi:acyl carrier protein
VSNVSSGVYPLRAAQNLIVENDDIFDTFMNDAAGQPDQTVLRIMVMREICRHLAPFQIGEKPITGDTVIAKDLTIDSLAVMDMVMELEDHFDISIPMNVMAEIQTVDQLADTVLKLNARS